MMFLDCPAYLDQEGAVRCGLPAEVRRRFIMLSTDGPLESAMIRCPAGHWFNGPIEALTWHGKHKHEPGAAGVAASARRDSHEGSDDGRGGTGRLAAQDFPAERGQDVSRPNGAPAYYLGRPARVWITVTGPRRRRTPQASAQTRTGSQDQPSDLAPNAQLEPTPALLQIAPACSSPGTRGLEEPMRAPGLTS